MPEELKEQGHNQVEEENQSPVPSEEAQTDELPEDAQERTRKEFEKLKENNRKLKEELDKQRQNQPSVLDSLNPTYGQPQVSAQSFSNLNQSQVDSIAQSLTTKGDDGYEYVDTAKLNEALKQANERAKRAEEQARQAQERFSRYEETQQVREAHRAFPELDPKNENYNPTFYNEVRDKLIAQAFRGEKDLLKAASEVAEIMGIGKQKAQQAEQKQAKVEQAQTQKQQIASSGTRSTNTQWDHDRLVSGTRMGQPGALAERLKRSGY